MRILNVVLAMAASMAAMLLSVRGCSLSGRMLAWWRWGRYLQMVYVLYLIGLTVLVIMQQTLRLSHCRSIRFRLV